MVTLPKMLSNRPCHSLSQVRVKNDTMQMYDADDTFITGRVLVQLLKQRTHFTLTACILVQQCNFAIV